MGWGDPVVGGVALRRAAIRSPNYSAGATGWTINQDGSVEFNSGTFRGTVTAGTFQGTDFVINSTGEFFYSAVPAAGDLTESIVPGAAGTDAFGNHYVQGVGSYDNSLNTFAQILGSKIFCGQIVAGVPDTAHAGGMDAFNTAPGALFLQSGLDPSLPTTDQAEILLNSGLASSGTGSGSNPTVTIGDSAGNSAVDVLVSGNVIGATNGGIAATWQAVSFAAGYTAGAVAQYRRDAFDNVVWDLSFVQTTGVAGSGGAVVTTAVPAAFRPKAVRMVPCAWESTGSVAKGAAVLVFNTSGTISLLWPSTTANGDKFAAVVSIPLGNIA